MMIKKIEPKTRTVEAPSLTVRPSVTKFVLHHPTTTNPTTADLTTTDPTTTTIGKSLFLGRQKMTSKSEQGVAEGM